MPIRFVYFDLGNVLIHFSVHRMLCQLAELAQKSEAEIQELLFDEQRYRGYEVGEKSTEEFLDMICQSLESTPDRDALIHAICDIFWANDPILSIARKLSTTDFPRGILSNTNPLHWRYVETAFPRIWGFFPNHKIASFEARSLKPFPEIYQIAFDDAKREIPDLQPNEVLLIDDLEANVKAAQEFGFQTIHYTEFDDFLIEYKKTGLPLPSRYVDGADQNADQNGENGDENGEQGAEEE